MVKSLYVYVVVAIAQNCVLFAHKVVHQGRARFRGLDARRFLVGKIDFGGPYFIFFYAAINPIVGNVVAARTPL